MEKLPLHLTYHEAWLLHTSAAALREKATQSGDKDLARAASRMMDKLDGWFADYFRAHPAPRSKP